MLVPISNNAYVDFDHVIAMQEITTRTKATYMEFYLDSGEKMVVDNITNAQVAENVKKFNESPDETEPVEET